MQATITMGQAPAVRASRALRHVNVRKMCVRTLALARSLSPVIASVSTVALYVGLISGSDTLACASAAVAMTFVCLSDSSRKGGDK